MERSNEAGSTLSIGERMSTEKEQYINIMIDSLEKKESLLLKIIERNTRQAEIIANGEFDEIDWDEFNILVGEKESFIERINELDSGFELLYGRVNEELKDNKSAYAEEIKRMQELIVSITDAGNKIMAGEERNRGNMERILLAKKKDIKEAKKSIKVASNYYKNMSNMLGSDAFGTINQKK